MPRDDLVVVGGVGVDPDDNFGKVGIAKAEGGVVAPHALGRAVDGVEVHLRELAWDFAGVVRMLRNRFITHAVDKIGPPIPLETWG